MRADLTSSETIDVLIAEDDEVLRKSLRTLLEQAGYRCAEAANGQEVVDSACRHRPLCVFVDLVMPGLDGFAVVRRLRSDPRTRGIPIHFLSPHPDPRVRAQAGLAAGEVFLTGALDTYRMLELVRAETQRPKEEWLSGLTKSQAEDVLDALENSGCARSWVACSGAADFAVRRDPPHGQPLRKRG